MKGKIQAAHETRPFLPFEIELVNGRVLQVRHPEFLYVPPGRGLYFVFTNAEGTPETFNAIMVLSVRPMRTSQEKRRKAG